MSRASQAGAAATRTRPAPSAQKGRRTKARRQRRQWIRRVVRALKSGVAKIRSGEWRQSWNEAADPRKRSISLLAALLILFGLVATRLLWVQVVGAGSYVAYGDEQRVATIELAAGRGSMFDRNGQDLATTVPQTTVVADPRLVTDPTATAQKLAPLLGIDEPTIYKQLTRNSAFSYLARRVSDEVADKVEAADLDGIYFVEEDKRFNPGGMLAHSLLGDVNIDNEGTSGLEMAFNKAMTGSAGEMILERDPEGRTIPAGRRHLDPAEPGDDLGLTLDRNLQVQAEDVMRNTIAATGAKAGTAIISDPETGEIFAVVNLARDEATSEIGDNGNNIAVTTNYEPGSVNKVITMAAALEEGLVTPETMMQVPMELEVADAEFTDDHHHPETISATDVLAQSSNVGAILLAQQLGKEKLYDYLRAFGLGEPTALGLPHEAAGQFPEPNDWSGTSIGTIPLGQGISVTAMQMLYAFNVIANDGVYVPPKLVDEIFNADGERTPGPQGQSKRIVSARTARQLRQMMSAVVTEGTGSDAAVEGYNVAGKTGSARKPSPTGGYLWPDGPRYVTTFGGFMPADDPKLSILVTLDETEDPYAASTAAPAFAELARHSARQLRLPPPAAAVNQGESTDPQRGTPAGATEPELLTEPEATPTEATGATGPAEGELPVVPPADANAPAPAPPQSPVASPRVRHSRRRQTRI